MNEVTVVIPSKNEDNTLIKCINLLLEQSYKFDIIIADSSDYAQNDLISLSKKYNNIRIVRGGMPSIARNIGYSFVKTKYVLFLDADIMLYDKDIIKNCIDSISTYDLITCEYNSDDNHYNWVWKIFSIIQRLSPQTFVLGGFQFWKSDLFKKLGMFDEKALVAEDWLLSKKIPKNKMKVLKSKVYTSSRRFQKKGVLYMFFLMLGCWINKNNISWFYVF